MKIPDMGPYVRRFACLGLLLLAGCATPGWKGTPYYHTKPDEDPLAKRDRVFLGVVNYQHPTLSVLGILEKSDEYLALRPFYSAYGLDKPAGHQVYSFLWPLGQFNREEKENRFVPFFWGQDYVVGFPLYWHFDHPLGPDGGVDALFPLWFCSTDKRGYSFNILWPVFNIKDDRQGRGWRLWPLVGAYSDGPEYYRFLAWPLAHQWSASKGATRGSAVLPLYLNRSTPTDRSFYSLLYSRHRDADSGWDLLLPLLFHSRGPGGSMTLTPLFFRGASGDAKDAWQLFLPLYYSQRSDDSRTFFTLLGGKSRTSERTAWAALPLLAGGIHRKDGTGLVLSIPWSHGSSADGRRWSLVPPFLFKTADGKDRKLFTPFYSAGTSHEGAVTWQTVVPLWYRSEGAGEKMFATILGGWQTGAEGRNWLIWPLLSAGYKGADSRDLWVLAPLFHARWDRYGVSHHLLPLYWWGARDNMLISPFVAKWGNKDKGSKTTLVPPALTLHSEAPARKDLWTAGGVAHFSWGKEAGSSHVLPLYYRDPRSATFLSLPWSTWTWNGSTTNTVVAPALSWLTRREGRSDLWALGPLVHQSWGEKAGSSHVIPFYYRDKREDTFISLPYAHWKDREAEYDLYPPLLSMAKRGENSSAFYSPLFGWDTDARSGFYYFMTPLAGVRTGRHSGGWVYPFWSRDHDEDMDETTGTFLWGAYSRTKLGLESSMIPFFGYSNRKYEPAASFTNSWGATMGKTFWSLPAVWYRNTVEVKPVLDEAGRPSGQVETSSVRDHGCFPFWTYTRRMTGQGADETFGSLLLLLYHYRTTLTPVVQAGAQPRETVSKRVLWWLWNYQRDNDMVSVDVFPGITYDAGADGFRKWSFLWRAFRYEKGPGGKKLDLLYIPLMR